jgi:hypothetical protein
VSVWLGTTDSKDQATRRCRFRRGQGGLVEATHTGSGYFSIKDLDAANEMDELLRNAVGAYSGATAFGFGMSDKGPVNFEVTASGPWKAGPAVTTIGSDRTWSITFS